MLGNDPANDLCGIDIYGKGFHSDMLRAVAIRLARVAVIPVDLAQGKVCGSGLIDVSSKALVRGERARTAAGVGFISCKDCDALFHKAQGPRLPSVEPKSPPGCSDRTATGPSAMLRR